MTIIALPDSRTLHIEVTGPPLGLPVVFHHGTPGSVLRFTGFQHAVHEHGLRLVRYSRAGYGQSSRLPGRAIADVARDISAILDNIGAPRCLVVGRSGGGPHCLLLDRLAQAPTARIIITGSSLFRSGKLDPWSTPPSSTAGARRR
jgi:pimeloyl-ACP methyl ester carboxylesterase